MRRLLCAICGLALLAGCAAPAASDAPAGPKAAATYVRPDGAVVLRPLTMPGGPENAMTDTGFYLCEYSGQTPSPLLTFYDFETLSQRVVCRKSGCDHTGGDCPALVGGSPMRIGDWLYFFYPIDPDNSALGMRVDRRDLNGENQEHLGEVGGQWMFSAGCYTDETHLYTYRGSDFVCIELPACHVTVIERYRPDKPVDAEHLLTMTAPSGQVYYLGWDPDKVCPWKRLGQEGDTVYGADPLNGWIYAWDAATGHSRVLSRGLNQYLWTWDRPVGWDDQGRENRWETPSSVQYWTGTLADGVLPVDIHGPSAQDRDAQVRVAVDLEDGSVTQCPLTDFWLDASHPIRILASTDYGLLVIPYTESTPGLQLGNDGTFYSAYADVRTVYALISREDFLAGVPRYQIFKSLFEKEGEAS